MAKLKGCVFVARTTGPMGCCAFMSGLVGQVMPGCSEDGQPSCGSPHYGAGSGRMAWTRRQGRSLQERGCGSLHWGQQVCCGFGSSCMLVLSLRSRAEMFVEGSLAERGVKGGSRHRAGPDPAACTPLREPGSNLRCWGDANASAKQKAEQ